MKTKKTIATLLMMVLIIPLFMPKQVEAASEKDSEIVMDTYNWVCDKIWNNYFCDVYHYIESGAGSVGQKMNIKKCIKNGSKEVQKLNSYDSKMKKLSNTKKNKKIKNIWKNLKKEIISLDKKLQKKTPKAFDETYKFNTEKFQKYMYQLLDNL